MIILNLSVHHLTATDTTIAIYPTTLRIAHLIGSNDEHKETATRKTSIDSSHARAYWLCSVPVLQLPGYSTAAQHHF
ncbi:hypothetical protein RSAG8_02912, partial [Rhizoctonia solani AG-8 WAC10335]